MEYKSDIRAEATLNINTVSIYFHAVCEVVSSQLLYVVLVKGKNNLADC